MRIVGGRLRGLKLAEVGAGDAAAHLRPTPDRVREAIFNVLASGAAGNAVAGAHVLDLFAGTGALGLEALSRGAHSAVLIDSGRAAAALVARNITLTRTGEHARLLVRDATNLGPSPGPACDLVFLDPPYGSGLGGRALAAARAGGWIAPGALVVWEDDTARAPPPGFQMHDRRRFGTTLVTLWRAV